MNKKKNMIAIERMPIVRWSMFMNIICVFLLLFALNRSHNSVDDRQWTGKASTKNLSFRLFCWLFVCVRMWQKHIHDFRAQFRMVIEINLHDTRRTTYDSIVEIRATQTLWLHEIYKYLWWFRFTKCLSGEIIIIMIEAMGLAMTMTHDCYESLSICVNLKYKWHEFERLPARFVSSLPSSFHLLTHSE